MDDAEVVVNPKIRMVDESLTQGMVEDPVLIICPDGEHLSYIIIDATRQKAVALAEYHHSPGQEGPLPSGRLLLKVKQEDEILGNRSFDKVLVAVYSDIHSLIPTPLFSKERIRGTLELTNSIQGEAFFLDDTVTSANARFIYACDGDLVGNINHAFGEPLIIHANSSFIEAQLRLNKHETDKIVAVNLRPGNIDIVVTSANTLLFFNTFPAKTAEEFIYYLLFTMEQLELNPDQAPVRCYGDIENTGAGWMLARKYIRNVQLGERPGIISYSYGFERFPAHQYYALFSQYLCVS